MIIWVATLAFSPTPSARTTRVDIEVDGTKWSYQAAQNIVNFTSIKDNTFDEGLLGWGDLVLMGPNTNFKGTLGETPQPNGIGGDLTVTGSLVDDILKMRAKGYVMCNGTAYEWVYDYYGILMPVWVHPEPIVEGNVHAGRTIVGSVIREKDHPNHGSACDPNKLHLKGQTGSFWMVLATDRKSVV